MAARHTASGNSEIRAHGFLVALVVGYLLTSTTAVASNNNLCDASEENDVAEPFEMDLMRADVEAPAQERVKPLVADDRESDKRRLPPAIEAALRDADEAARSSIDSKSVNPPLTTRVPGLSDEAMARYKRYMYRKDI